MTMIVLDFETYYDADYSLRKMTTLEYVFDKRFHIHGMGYWFLGTEPPPRGLPESGYLTGDQIGAFLRQLDWSQTAVVGHNLMFDGMILARHFNISRCSQWFDTLGMSRYVIGQTIPSLSLGAVYTHLTGSPAKVHAGALTDVKGVRHLSPEQSAALGEYCMDDVWETGLVFTILIEKFPLREWIKLHWCIDMWLNPKLTLNRAVLEATHAEEVRRKAELLERVAVPRTSLSSNPKFADMLRANGITPPMKKSPTTGKDTFAFSKSDEDFMELLTHESETVRDLVAARLAVKSTITETRALRFLKVHELTGGAFPVPLNYCGAMQTGRLSASESLNVQNMGRGSTLRTAVEAPAGYKVVALDLSNIELRINMVGCRQEDAVEAIRKGEDLYCKFASSLFGKPVTKKDPDERMVGKVAELSLGYGAGGPTFKKMLFVQTGKVYDLEFAVNTVAVYRASKRSVSAMWSVMRNYVEYIGARWGGAFNANHIGFMTGTYNAPVTFHDDGIVMPSGFKIKYYDAATKHENKIDHNGAPRANKVTTYRRYGAKAVNGRAYLYHGVVIENLAQALAAEVLWDMVMRIHAATGYMPAMQVHDEIVFVIPDSGVEAFKSTALKIMHQSPSWWMDLPVAAEAGVGQNYGEAK